MACWKYRSTGPSLSIHGKHSRLGKRLVRFLRGPWMRDIQPEVPHLLDGQPVRHWQSWRCGLSHGQSFGFRIAGHRDHFGSCGQELLFQGFKFREVFFADRAMPASIHENQLPVTLLLGLPQCHFATGDQRERDCREPAS